MAHDEATQDSKDARVPLPSTPMQDARHHLERLRRLYATLSACLGAVIAAETRDDLLRRTCEAAVSAGGFRFAWVGLVEQESLRIRPGAFSGAELGYLQELDLSLDAGTRGGQGPMGVALREDRQTHVADFLHDPWTAPWQGLATARGYRSAVFCPLHVGGRVIGGLGIYAAEAYFFQPEELVLVQEIARSLDLALDRLDARQSGKAARDLSLLLDLAVQQSHDAVVITLLPPGGGPPEAVFVNHAFTELTGYSLEDLKAGAPGIVPSSPEAVEGMLAALKGHRRSGETVLLRKDGSRYDAAWSMQSLLGADGRPRHVVITQRDISEHRRQEEALRFLALHDPLTGLPNRLLLQDRLQLALARAQRDGDPFAIVMMDLDNFKLVNDSLGHADGDLVLQHLASRLRSALRQGDTLARFGGDEFVAVIGHCRTSQDLEHVLSRLKSVTDAPFPLHGHDYPLDLSLGVAVFPGDGRDAETLLRRADSALYDAKSGGGGRCRYFDAAREEAQAVRAEMRRDLARALREGQLRLYYQPQVDLKTRRVRGVEALVRWILPSGHMLLPDEFLPAVDESSLVPELGRWVFEEALRQADDWQRQGVLLRVAVNVPPSYLQLPTFGVDVEQGLSRHPHLDRGRIELEITEGSGVPDERLWMQRLRDCRELGLHIAIDDFGTGYSSFSRLIGLEAALIKIDRGFIASLPDSRPAYSLVRGMVSIVQATGSEVLAEGVETPQQAGLLQDIGCSLAQGNLISPPMPAEHVTPWIAAWLRTAVGGA